MKRLLICTGLFVFAAAAFAQQSTTAQSEQGAASQAAAPAPKKAPASPPATVTANIAAQTITIEYSSPGVKGREGKIFTKDGLISHDAHYPVWRAGANAATKLHITSKIRISNLEIPKGDYTLFVDISDPDNWILIVSKKTGESGLAYDAAEDLGRVNMAMNKPQTMVENLKYTITDVGNSTAVLMLSWENHTASVPVLVY